MASQVVDSLLQGMASTRNVDPPPRVGDGSGTFAPVLDRALRPGERPRTRDAANSSNDANAGAAATPRSTERHDDDAAADDAAADDAAELRAVETTADEEASNAPRDDNQDAAEISAVGAAAVETQAATVVAADSSTGDTGDVDAAQSLAAAGATAQSESGEEAPQNGLPAGASATSGQEELELGDAPPVNGAVEIGDVQQLPVRSPKADATGIDAAESGEQSSAPETTQATAELADEGRLAGGQENGEATAVAEPEPGDGGETPWSDGDEREAHKSHQITEVAEVAALAPEAGAIPEAGETPDDRNASQAAAAPSAAEASPARSAATLGRLSANRSSPSSAEQGDSDATGHVDRARFLGRVEGAIRSAQQRDGRVQVRLSPPELGALRIELTVQHGVLNARLEAETTAARNLLLENLPALRDRLAQQDIRVERFDVDVRRDGGGSNQQGAQDRPSGDPGWQDDGRRERSAARQTEATRGPMPGATRIGNDAALDVRV